MSQQHLPRPIVGVVGNQYLRANTTRTIIAGMVESYARALEAAGAIPLLIYLTEDAEVLDRLYALSAGLVFIGGEDVDPKHFGAERHPQLGTVVPLRDQVELALARRAAADRKPMLGICRGVQLLNVALGGTLYQDIPAELPGTADHYGSRGLPHGADTIHPIAIEPDSWLAERLGADALAVNSYHHQSLKDIAPGLRVTGRAPDGVIEAVEGAGPGFILGVQCHPEEMWDSAEPRWARVFAGFVDEVRRSAAL
jgi:putative glutamine amidotransferase